MRLYDQNHDQLNIYYLPIKNSNLCYSILEIRNVSALLFYLRDIRKLKFYKLHQQ